MNEKRLIVCEIFSASLEGCSVIAVAPLSRKLYSISVCPPPLRTSIPPLGSEEVINKFQISGILQRNGSYYLPLWTNYWRRNRLLRDSIFHHGAELCKYWDQQSFRGGEESPPCIIPTKPFNHEINRQTTAQKKVRRKEYKTKLFAQSINQAAAKTTLPLSQREIERDQMLNVC